MERFPLNFRQAMFAVREAYKLLSDVPSQALGTLVDYETGLLSALNHFFNRRHAGQPHAFWNGALIRAMGGDCACIYRARSGQ